MNLTGMYFILLSLVLIRKLLHFFSMRRSHVRSLLFISVLYTISALLLKPKTILVSLFSVAIIFFFCIATPVTIFFFLWKRRSIFSIHVPFLCLNIFHTFPCFVLTAKCFSSLFHGFSSFDSFLPCIRTIVCNHVSFPSFALWNLFRSYLGMWHMHVFYSNASSSVVFGYDWYFIFNFIQIFSQMKNISRLYTIRNRLQISYIILFTQKFE